MSARQSAEVTRALRLIDRGSTPYAAAKRVGIALSTIYRAQVRQRATNEDPNPAPEAPLPTVQYDREIPATVRAYCDRHADRISSVDYGGRGSRAETWRYMAWLRSGWNCGDDTVHSVIGDTAADLITRLGQIAPCTCETCRSATA